MPNGSIGVAEYDELCRLPAPIVCGKRCILTKRGAYCYCFLAISLGLENRCVKVNALWKSKRWPESGLVDGRIFAGRVPCKIKREETER